MMQTNQTLHNSKLADKTFIVGGAIRDSKLNQPVNDIDFVVTASEAEFRNCFPNAELVGNDFPVFLIEGDEVALSRTERSNGDGYGAFELTGVGVSIEEDLKRRDFTINAMAMNIVTGEIVDPLNGLDDLKNGVIRITHNDSFDDDPVRILRALRFATRFGFELDAATKQQAQLASKELKHVTKERIVLELTKVWKQATKPSNFFRAALNSGALANMFPVLAQLDTVPAGPSKFHGDDTAFDHTMKTVDRAKQLNASFHVFAALLFHDAGKAFTDPKLLPHHWDHEDRSFDFVTTFLKDHKFTKRVNEFVPKAAKLHMKAHNVTTMNAKSLVKFANDLGRRDFDDMMTVFECDHSLNTAQQHVFNVLRAMLFDLDLSSVADVAPRLRAQRAHQLRVAFVKNNR